MTSSWQPQFLYAVCQQGAEAALKSDLARSQPELRFAFSRPGFVTFKLPEQWDAADNHGALSAFARTWGYSLGRLEAEQAEATVSAQSLAERLWELPHVQALLAEHQPGDLHVWQRDRAPVGKGGFAPGITPLALEIRQLVGTASPTELLRQRLPQTQSPSPRNQWVLDVTLVEPNQWWIGCHQTINRASCWPGGVPNLTLPPEAISRAYLKMSEALKWSALPMTRGQHCVELGCAPGGASQRLLEEGLHVIGIDPAEVDPTLLDHERFTHLRKRASDARRSVFANVQWLATDLNATPTYTLDAVEAIIRSPKASLRGMILTLKLTDWALADQLPECIQRIKSWGYQDVRVRQLAFNGKEVCVVALRSRNQRRVRRKSSRGKQQPEGQRHRLDPAHASTPPPHAPQE